MIHQACGGELIVELETHNSIEGMAPTAIYFECEKCRESYRMEVRQ